MAYYKYKTTPVTSQIWVHVYSMILQQDDGFGNLIPMNREQVRNVMKFLETSDEVL